MNIAYTELHDLLLKLFEGQKFPLGDFEDATTTLAWLALHGWPIFDELADAAQLTKTSPVDVSYQDNQLLIDASHNDGLIYGGLALEMALLHAQTAGAAQLTITNVNYPQLLLPTLCKIGERGHACVARWAWQGTEWYISIEAGHNYPTAVSFPSSNQANAKDVIVYLGSAVSLAPSPPSGTTITPAQFQTNRDQAILNGLTIETAVWQRLLDLSHNVLVEATEASRLKGAGEQA